MDFYVVKINGETFSERFSSLGEAIDFSINSTEYGEESKIFEAVIEADGRIERLCYVLSHTKEKSYA